MYLFFHLENCIKFDYVIAFKMLYGNTKMQNKIFLAKILLSLQLTPFDFTFLSLMVSEHPRQHGNDDTFSIESC